jgi:hypothetical protein
VVTKHPSKSLSNPSDDNEQIITPVAPGLTLKRDLDTLSPQNLQQNSFIVFLELLSKL